MKECFNCNSNNLNMDNNIHDKEDFICPACIGAGFAAMGIGATAAGSKMSKNKYKLTKNILFWSGIVSILIAIILIIWGVMPKKYGGCNSCKAK